MFSVDQLSARVQDLTERRLDFGAFEDWFQTASGDVDFSKQDARDMVFAVEDILSRYHYEGLRGDLLLRELATAIRPFVSGLALIVVFVSAGHDTSTGVVSIRVTDGNGQWSAVGSTASANRQVDMAKHAAKETAASFTCPDEVLQLIA
jgi:hypothetical protein